MESDPYTVFAERRSDRGYGRSYDTIRDDKLYLRAPKSQRAASLICRTEPANRKSNEENYKQETEMLRRNGPVIKSVESVLRPERSLWWEIFVKEVGFEAGVEK